MIYDFDKTYTYEEKCQEILAYINCQNESFDFGEGEMFMEEGGEYAYYKVQIQDYLNSFYDDYDWWIKHNNQIRFNEMLEQQFDDYINYKLMNKSNNKYLSNQEYKNLTKKRYYEYFKLYYGFGYYQKLDENGKEYFVKYNRGKWSKCLKKKATNKMKTTKYKLMYFPKGNTWKKTYNYW